MGSNVNFFKKSLGTTEPDCHILDKSFSKKFFVKEYSFILKYRFYRTYTKFLKKIFIYSIYNSVLSADKWTNKNAN